MTTTRLRYFTSTSAQARPREYVHVVIRVPVPSPPEHPMVFAQAGKLAVDGFFERVGPDHPETLIARMRGLEFR